MSLSRRIAAHARRPRAMHGVVLLALLLALAIGAIAAMAAVDVWAVTRQREREAELLFAGGEYRTAIRRYFYATSPRVYPASFDELLEDKRFPIPIRHLRKLYRDPITGNTEWGAVRVADRITGVFSLSEAQPIKQEGFEPINSQFAGKASYRDWQFVVTLPSRATPRKSATDPAPSDNTGAPPPDRSQPVPRKPS